MVDTSAAPLWTPTRWKNLQADVDTAEGNVTTLQNRVTGLHGVLPVATGGFVQFSLNATGLTTAAMTADRMQAIPIYPARTLTFDRLLGYATTGVAATNVRFGLYADNGSGRPGALLADTGNVSTATSSSILTGTITPVTLEAGTVYWAVAIYSGAPTLRVFQAGSLLMAETPDGSAAGAPAVLHTVQAFGALPSTAPAFTTTSNTFPFMRARVA